MQSRLAALGGVALLACAFSLADSLSAASGGDANALPGTILSARSNAKARGADLFASKGCAHCHGPAGVGGAKGPDLQRVRDRMDTAALAKQIRDGSLSMPAFATQLDDRQLRDLVEYLRAKRKLVGIPEKSPEPTTPKPYGRDPD